MSDPIYEEGKLIQKVPRQIAMCDELAGKLPFRSEYERSKLAPVFQSAALGLTKAMYYCLRQIPLSPDTSNSTHGENLLTCVKLAGKDIIGEEGFTGRIENLRMSGQGDWIRKIKKALRNRKNYAPRTAVQVKLYEGILSLWFPCLLWLMSDSLAVYILKNLRTGPAGEEAFPFRGVTDEAYGQARLRLEGFGLKRWKSFYAEAPVREVDLFTGRLTFAPKEDCGGFDFGLRED